MTLNLYELDTPLEPVRFVKDGPEYAFHHLDGISQQVLVATRKAEPEVRLKAMYDILARCFPDAPREEVDAIPADHLDLLLSLAGRNVKTVEEYMDLSRGKDPATDEASTSETPSPTPSPESPRRSAGGRRKSGAVPTG